MIQDDIKQFFRGDVATDEETLEKYSHDYSIFVVKPRIVVFPKDAEDVKNLVQFVNESKGKDKTLSLTGRSAGTDMSGGPLNESLIVDFTRYMNRIIEIGSDYVRLEPGVYFRDLEKQLDSRGLLYPPFPASKHLCAIGGMVSNNSGGEKSLAYGQTKKYVKEIKIVMADGEEHLLKSLAADELQTKLKEESFEGDIYRKLHKLIEENYEDIEAARPQVSKNSAGYLLWDVWSPTLSPSPKRLRRLNHSYGDGADKNTFDITKIIVGSQGTLGLITEVKLALLPKKKFSRLAVVFTKQLEPLTRLVNAALKFEPESLEFYDDKTLGIAIRFLPDLIKTMKQGLITLAFRFLPELWLTIKGGGLPKIILLVELTSDDKTELDNRLVALKKEVEKLPVQIRLIKDEKEAEKYWTVRRQSFALLHGHNPKKSTVPFIDDIIVKPEYLPEFLPKVNAILAPHKDKLIYTIAGHAGDGNFHIIPLMDLKDPEARGLIPKISEEVYSLIKEYNGSITAEHNDGLIRTPYLKMMYSEKILGLFEEVKKIFDPLNIFNPRKKVGGDLNYSLEHIKDRVGQHGS